MSWRDPLRGSRWATTALALGLAWALWAFAYYPETATVVLGLVAVGRFIDWRLTR